MKIKCTDLGRRSATFGYALQLDGRVLRADHVVALHDPRTAGRHQDGQRRLPGPDGRFVALARAHLALVHSVVVQRHGIQFQVVFA